MEPLMKEQLTPEENAEILQLSGQTWEDRELFYAQVGQGISLWSSMEEHLVEIAARLLNTRLEKAGLVLYSINNFYAWLNIIDDLFGLAPEYGNFKKSWTEASANLRSLNDTRVRLAHHTVFHLTKTPQPTLRPSQFDARSKSKKYDPLTGIEILQFTVDVVAATKALVDLRKSMDSKTA
jgi:hypothetical protein